jgi:WD40 repeat protein
MRSYADTSAHDNTVRIWDAAGSPVGDPLKSRRGTVHAVVVGQLADRDVIVSGCVDGTVRIWDATGHPVEDPITGHTIGVVAVAIGRLGDQEVIVSGSFDDTVRIWHATGNPVGDQLTLVESCAALAFTEQGIILGTGNSVALLEIN